MKTGKQKNRPLSGAFRLSCAPARIYALIWATGVIVAATHALWGPWIWITIHLSAKVVVNEKFTILNQQTAFKAFLSGWNARKRETIPSLEDQTEIIENNAITWKNSTIFEDNEIRDLSISSYYASDHQSESSPFVHNMRYISMMLHGILWSACVLLCMISFASYDRLLSKIGLSQYFKGFKSISLVALYCLTLGSAVMALLVLLHTLDIPVKWKHDGFALEHVTPGLTCSSYDVSKASFFNAKAPQVKLPTSVCSSLFNRGHAQKFNVGKSVSGTISILHGPGSGLYNAILVLITTIGLCVSVFGAKTRILELSNEEKGFQRLSTDDV